MNIATALQAADDELNSAISHVLYGTDTAVIVQSPPGAGKTYLVECAAAVAMNDPGLRVLVVTPGVKQAYDVAERLLTYDLPRLELAHAKHRRTPPQLLGRLSVSSGWDGVTNLGPGVLVANAHVPASYLPRLRAGSFDLMIVDEAYQLAATDFLPVADLAPRVMMVGDPGQLPPVISVETDNLEAAVHKVHLSAPQYLLDRHPATPVYKLPVTRRLLPDTAELVQKAFYPNLPFVSVVNPAERSLTFDIAGVEPVVDEALDAIAAGASLVSVVLPGKAPPHQDADPDVTKMMAHIAARFETRGARWNGRLLGQDDIGCIDPHRISNGAISEHLRQAGKSGIKVDTVEHWQGLQIPIAVVRHPLSRVGKPMPFDLQAGRWCVTLSRHLLGCVIVSRGSVEDVIDGYIHGCDTAAAGADDFIWSGFEAHRMTWNILKKANRIFKL